MTIDYTREVVYAADCKPCTGCDDVICPKCDMHYFECPCPGPDSDPEEEQ